MLKHRRIFSVILAFSIIITSLFTAGIINASAKTSENGKMLKVSASNKGTRNNFMLPVEIKNGKTYSVTFDYYLSGSFTTLQSTGNAFRVIAKKTNSANEDLKDLGNNFLDPEATAGRHSYNAEFTANQDYKSIGFTTRFWNMDSLDIYVWNFKVKESDSNTNLATSEDWENESTTAFTIESVNYDGNIVGFDIPMYHMIANDWKTSSITLSNADAGDYTISFDYYTKRLDATNGSFALNTNWVNNRTYRVDQKYLSKGLQTASLDFNWPYQNDLEIQFNLKYAEVYFWNVKLTKKGEDKNLIDNSALSASGINNGVGVEKTEYDESVFVNSADCVPELLGAQIRTGTAAADEQKIRIAFDFSNLQNAVDNNIAINEKGVIVVADDTSGGMTAEEIVNKAQPSNYITIDELSKDGIAYVTVSRNGVSAYGKRIAAVAYIKTAGGTYYSNTASKSVMGVMKAIFGNDKNLETEKISKDNINNTLNGLSDKVSLKKSNPDAAYITDTFKGYTGYDKTPVTVTVKSDADTYADAKTITAATYFYVTQ